MLQRAAGFLCRRDEAKTPFVEQRPALHRQAVLVEKGRFHPLHGRGPMVVDTHPDLRVVAVFGLTSGQQDQPQCSGQPKAGNWR